MINNYDQADHLNLPSGISHVCKGRLKHQPKAIVVPYLGDHPVMMGLMMQVGTTKLEMGQWHKNYRPGI